jgi:hypothetical protein
MFPEVGYLSELNYMVEQSNQNGDDESNKKGKKYD